MSTMQVEVEAFGIGVMVKVTNPTRDALIVLNAVNQKRRGVHVFCSHGTWIAQVSPEAPATEAAYVARMMRESEEFARLVSDQLGISEPITDPAAEVHGVVAPAPTPTPAHKCQRCGEAALERFGNGGPIDLCDDCQED